MYVPHSNLNIFTIYDILVFYLEFIYKDKLDIHKTCFFNENASPTKRNENSIVLLYSNFV